MIRTIDYGLLPIAVDTRYIYDEIIDTVETCDGSFYTVQKAFTGSIVAVKR